MTALNKQAQAIISDIRLKRGSGDVYAPIIRWDEFEVITGALESAQKLATQQGNIAVELFDEVTRLQRSADDKAPELREQLEAAENELSACKNILEKIKSTSCHVDTSPGAFIPNSLDAWGRPVPQYLPYNFSGNSGASATQYCNGWNDAGGYWLNHVKYLQECICAAGIGVKGE